MMFRRLRSASRPVLCFRATMFFTGLLYVVATTDTVKTLVMGLDAVKMLGYSVVKIESTITPTTKTGTSK